MRELTKPFWIYLKGLLFLLLGVLAASVLLASQPEWKTAFLLAVTVWAFCRFYYFMFYVIERYVDATYKFSGIASFIRYLLRPRRRDLRRPGPQ